MDSQVQYQYELKQSLNDECETFSEFVNYVYSSFYGIELERDAPINIVILINTQHLAESSDEVASVTQTLKSFITKANKGVHKDIHNVKSEVANVKSSVNKI